MRLFVHREPYGRFVSCLVFLPRDRYTTRVRAGIAQLLVDAFGATSHEWNTRLSESVLARLHYVLHVDPAQPRTVDVARARTRRCPCGAGVGRRPARCARRGARRGGGTRSGAGLGRCVPGRVPRRLRRARSARRSRAARTAGPSHPARRASCRRRRHARLARPEALRHRRATLALRRAAAADQHGCRRRRRASVRADPGGLPNACG